MTGPTPAAAWDGTGLLRADVSRAQLEDSITELATRLGDPDAVPVLRARYELAAHRSRLAAAQDAFAAWAAAAAERDAADTSPIASVAASAIGALPWCTYCDRADQAEHLAGTGRPDDALQLAARLLGTPRTALCPDQPAAVIPIVLPALLESGPPARAAHEFLRAVRLLETPASGARLIRARAILLLICARTGRLQLGLDLLQGWLGWLREDTPPYLRMQLCAAGGRILRDVSEAGHGDLLVRRLAEPDGDGNGADEQLSADDLGAELLRNARGLAAEFDQRNQTQIASDLVDDFLDAERLPDLALDAILRSPRFAAVPPRPAEVSRGRRVRASPAKGGRTAAELPALVAEFDAALGADSQSRRAAVMTTWRTARDIHSIAVGAESQDAARLDGWLAVEDLHAWSGAEAADVLEPARVAARRLASSGLVLESLLHEQAALLAAAQSGAVAPESVRERIVQTTAEIAGRDDAGADLGVAWSRVALIDELAGPPDDSAEADPVELGLAALEEFSPDDLTHQQARAYARLLRLEAGTRGSDGAGALLERAIAVLPDGVRPIERALARTDLATLWQESDLTASARMWDAAIADAATADAEPLMGSLLASRALARQARGELDGAIADLSQAVPLLDRYAPPELAAQSRFDLARVLLAAGRFVESAAAAESALADLGDLTEQIEHTRQLSAEEPAVAHLAGCTAFTAAEAIGGLGDHEQARVLAELSAGWHEANGNLVAEAEAWQLAARLGGPPRQVAADLERAAELAEIGGEWSQAATCRRERAAAIRDADGIDAALAALDDAEKILVSRENLRGRHVSEAEARAAASMMLWHRLALSEQRARMLAVAARFPEAFSAADGLADGYTALGDQWSARDLLGLRGQLRAELGDLPGALADLERAAQEAAQAGDRDQARGLGERLAMVLDQAGRSWDAEQAYQRFAG